ncbi:MAG TPA: hypothetical protein VGC05_12375, partial [Mycobacterium sp.]
AWNAYAVLAGGRPDALAGTVFLVDPNGWLRAARRASNEPGWNNDPTLLISLIRQICEPLFTNLAGGGHEHHP